MTWHSWLAIAFVVMVFWGCKVDRDSWTNDVGQTIRNAMYQATGF